MATSTRSCSCGVRTRTSTAKEPSAGTVFVVVPADVQEIQTLDAALVTSERLLGKVDVLICGAAANFPAPAKQMTADGFRKVISTDLLGSFNAARAAFAQLKATRGNIIFVSATNSVMPFAFQAHVGAAKAGIDSLMRGLALHANLAGAEYLGDVWTAPRYRLYSIADLHPGMFEVERGGVAVRGELYNVPASVWRTRISVPNRTAGAEMVAARSLAARG